MKAFRVGAVDYVTKPFQFEEVYARVQTHLQLSRLERLRNDLTHMVIHDLRNPLTVICYFLDILEMDEGRNLSASTQKLVPSVRRSAEELRDMISSILDVSKMEAGEMTLQRESCELNALIRDIWVATQSLPGNRTVSFVAGESMLPVSVDVRLIRRVLQNLLSNALKYTSQGGEVVLAVTPGPDEIRVTVSDSGPGIAPEFQKRIFEKFGQVEDHNNRQGTGLGLTFCKMAIEAHGGRIGVDSEPGKGSSFWFTLPRMNGNPVSPD